MSAISAQTCSPNLQTVVDIETLCMRVCRSNVCYSSTLPAEAECFDLCLFLFTMSTLCVRCLQNVLCSAFIFVLLKVHLQNLRMKLVYRTNNDHLDFLDLIYPAFVDNTCKLGMNSLLR